MRILLVDDEDCVRGFVKDMLTENAHEVVDVNNASKALDVIKGGEKFDAVVTDLIMPGMDGVELTKELLQYGIDNSSVIMISGGAPDGKEELFKIAKGFFGKRFLKKPFEIDDLFILLDEIGENIG
ncbi:MAG: response regulator [bacterium]